MEDVKDQLRDGFERLMETLGPMQTYVTPTSALVGLGAGLSVYWLIKRSKYNLPPGPTPIPLIGNYRLMVGGMRDLPESCAKLSKTYGPVITIYMGPMPMVVVNTIEAATEVLIKSKADFADRPQMPSGGRKGVNHYVSMGDSDILPAGLELPFPPYDMIYGPRTESGGFFYVFCLRILKKPQSRCCRIATLGIEFSEGGKNIATAQYTPTLKLHRKVAGSALRNYLKGGKLEDAIHGSLSQVITLFEEMKGEPFVPHSYIDLCIFNVMCGFSFHKVYKFDDPQFKHLVDVDNELLAKFGSGFIEDMFPVLLNFWTSRIYKETMELAGELFQFIDGELQDHKMSFDEGNIRDFTDALILARREAENNQDAELLSQLTDVHLKQTLGDIFLAGFDTSRFTLQWFFLYMAANPDIQKKAQMELDKAIGRDRLPGLEDQTVMPYTEAALHETMRIATVAPFGVPHAARVDSKLCGYDIPKGTTVMINQWALHNDPQHWNDPAKFDPERFLNSDGNLAPKPVSWLPFSVGRRVCPGEGVAKPELHLICAIMLHQFDIMLPSGVTADFSPDISGFLGYSANQYKIVVKKRF